MNERIYRRNTKTCGIFERREEPCGGKGRAQNHLARHGVTYRRGAAAYAPTRYGVWRLSSRGVVAVAGAAGDLSAPASRNVVPSAGPNVLGTFIIFFKLSTCLILYHLI